MARTKQTSERRQQETIVTQRVVPHCDGQMQEFQPELAGQITGSRVI